MTTPNPPATRAAFVDSLSLRECLDLQASEHLPPDVFWLAWDRIDKLTDEQVQAALSTLRNNRTVAAGLDRRAPVAIKKGAQ